MARPSAKELTQRELEVMKVFWKQGELTAQGARDALARSGLDRAYTTVATLIRILCDKGFLKQTTDERPFGAWRSSRTRLCSSQSFLRVASATTFGDTAPRPRP